MSAYGICAGTFSFVWDALRKQANVFCVLWNYALARAQYVRTCSAIWPVPARALDKKTDAGNSCSSPARFARLKQLGLSKTLTLSPFAARLGFRDWFHRSLQVEARLAWSPWL